MTSKEKAAPCPRDGQEREVDDHPIWCHRPCEAEQPPGTHLGEVVSFPKLEDTEITLQLSQLHDSDGVLLAPMVRLRAKSTAFVDDTAVGHLTSRDCREMAIALLDLAEDLDQLRAPLPALPREQLQALLRGCEPWCDQDHIASAAADAVDLNTGIEVHAGEESTFEFQVGGSVRLGLVRFYTERDFDGDYDRYEDARKRDTAHAMVRLEDDLLTFRDAEQLAAALLDVALTGRVAAEMRR